MTGYGRVQRNIDGYSILLEIKSVNHRFFECSLRVPRLYGYLEEKLRALVQQSVSRGKVDVFLSVESEGGAEGRVTLNEKLAESYISALYAMQRKYGLLDDISASGVSRFADIFTVVRPPEDEGRVWEAVRQAAEEALGGLTGMREAEGDRLRQDLAQRAGRIGELVERIDARSPATVAEYRARLTARMKEILADAAIEENRILMEAALYADKVSVTEETVRLKSHLGQFAGMLAGEGPVGRRLDFLLQEMNREANTIGSKAADAQMSEYVVEIKAELEKIREQIQNIE